MADYPDCNPSPRYEIIREGGVKTVNSPDVNRIIEATEFEGPDAHAARVAFCTRLEGSLRVPD